MFDTGLSLLFFIQHSVMIRQSFRKKIAKILPLPYYNAFYAIIAGITLILVMVLWQKSSLSFWAVTGFYRWIFRLFFFVPILGFAWGVWALGMMFDPFGVKNLLDHVHGKQPKPAVFVAKGPYKWVRHPLYFLLIIIIWACPDLTADRLLFNILWTIWIVTGAIFEERDLVNELGAQYREYQKNVSMLIPWRLPRN